jgi:hypothetical protein
MMKIVFPLFLCLDAETEAADEDISILIAEHNFPSLHEALVYQLHDEQHAQATSIQF